MSCAPSTPEELLEQRYRRYRRIGVYEENGSIVPLYGALTRDIPADTPEYHIMKYRNKEIDYHDED